MSWKRIGIKGKACVVRTWPTFRVSIIQQSAQWQADACRLDGGLIKCLGLFVRLETAQLVSERWAVEFQEKERQRKVITDNPPAILGKRKHPKPDKRMESF